MHIETINTQVDLRDQVTELCQAQLESLIKGDLSSAVVEIEFAEEDEEEW